MNLVSSIIKRKGNQTISVTPETCVLDALKVMADKNIGSVVVMDGSKFLGLVTERDYSRKVILKGKNSTDTTVSEIMATDFPSLTLKDTVEYCMELLTKNNIRYLPVIENDSLKGIISMSDVVSQTILNQQQMIDHLDNYIRS